MLILPALINFKNLCKGRLPVHVCVIPQICLNAAFTCGTGKMNHVDRLNFKNTATAKDCDYFYFRPISMYLKYYFYGAGIFMYC